MQELGTIHAPDGTQTGRVLAIRRDNKYQVWVSTTHNGWYELLRGKRFGSLETATTAAAQAFRRQTAAFGGDAETFEPV